MADTSEISSDVRMLIAQRIDSVAQLELLLLVQGQKSRQWTADEVARELRIDLVASREQLHQLVSRDLLEKSDGNPETFWYRASTAALDQAVANLAVEYAHRRVTVIGLIYSKPIDTLRSFADAFRLFRRENSDG